MAWHMNNNLMGNGPAKKQIFTSFSRPQSSFDNDAKTIQCKTMIFGSLESEIATHWLHDYQNK